MCYVLYMSNLFFKQSKTKGILPHLCHSLWGALVMMLWKLSCFLMLQDFPTNSSVEDDVTSESSVADITGFIPKLATSPSLSHIISIGQLLESVIALSTLFSVLQAFLN